MSHERYEVEISMRNVANEKVFLFSFLISATKSLYSLNYFIIISISNQISITIMVAPMDYKIVATVMESWEKVRRLPDYLEIVGPKLFAK